MIPPFTGTPMSLGDTINGDISTPGEEDQYTFTLAADSLAAFDTLTADDGSLQWSLQGPSGLVVSNQSLLYSDSFYTDAHKLPAGDYQLTASASGGETGAYSFRLLDSGRRHGDCAGRAGRRHARSRQYYPFLPVHRSARRQVLLRLAELRRAKRLRGN